MRSERDVLLVGLGLAAGAGLMYLLDPERGRRRRALVRDQVVHGAHELEGLGAAAGARARDLRNRTRGALAEARGRIRREPVDDTVLEERVRAELGRLVTNPGAIEVAADHARVVLSGSVLAGEAQDLLRGVAGVRGVDEVVDRLSSYENPGGHPSLQGNRA